MSEEKIFCGHGQIKETQFGPLPKIYLTKEDLTTMIDYLAIDGEDMLTVVLKAKRQPKGKTSHYLEIDQWKPDKGSWAGSNKESASAPETQEQTSDSTVRDDLPF